MIAVSISLPSLTFPSVFPLPIANLGQVFAMLADVMFVRDELVAHRLLGVGGAAGEAGHAITERVVREFRFQVVCGLGSHRFW